MNRALWEPSPELVDAHDPTATWLATVAARVSCAADDDPTVRELLAVALGREGFRVWPAVDGHDALAVYQEHRQEIDVVLLDVQMPGMDGPHTLASLRQIDPEVRCCFMSGSPTPYTLHELRQLGAGCFFAKPLDVPTVSTMLRRQARLWAALRQSPGVPL